MPTAVVIGARRTRQGIGEFVTRWLHAGGAEIRGIVGTEPSTLDEALTNLKTQYGIEAHGYVSLDVALEEERPDIVAICSPYRFHRAQLASVAAFGCDCLCEKPMWWGDSADRLAATEAIVDSFATKGKILSLVTQWPFTLPCFYELYPEQKDRPVESFEMLLSPMTKGPKMLLDSVSHPISLLQELVGPGIIEEPQATYAPGSKRDDMTLSFQYRHATGTLLAKCRFATHPEPPRPAGYGINGCYAERRIDPEGYRIYFSSGEREVFVEDPVKRLAEDFLRRVETRQPVDRRCLLESITHLDTLHQAGIGATSYG